MTIPIPRPRLSLDVPPDRLAAEALRLDAIAASLLRFASEFADRAKPFETRARQYEACAAELRQRMNAEAAR